jgi:hypothetical protein
MTALLLTATIAPPVGTPRHVQFDPQERLAQYEASLRFYLSTTGASWKILFVDNSGYPLDPLRTIASENQKPDRSVYFLSYSSEVPAAWGKGRGEIALIETALDHFRDILAPNEPVWKITGRLKVRNIGRMIATQPESFNVYADLRDAPFIGDTFGGNQWADTRLIAFTPKGYDTYIRQAWPNKHINIERQMFKTLRQHVGPGSGVVPRFRTQPRFSGVSGGTGKNYNSPLEHTKTIVRIFTRALFPRLWI